MLEVADLKLIGDEFEKSVAPLREEMKGLRQHFEDTLRESKSKADDAKTIALTAMGNARQAKEQVNKAKWISIGISGTIGFLVSVIEFFLVMHEGRP